MNQSISVAILHAHSFAFIYAFNESLYQILLCINYSLCCFSKDRKTEIKVTLINQERVT